MHLIPDTHMSSLHILPDPTSPGGGGSLGHQYGLRRDCVQDIEIQGSRLSIRCFNFTHDLAREVVSGTVVDVWDGETQAWRYMDAIVNERTWWRGSEWWCICDFSGRGIRYARVDTKQVPLAKYQGLG